MLPVIGDKGPVTKFFTYEGGKILMSKLMPHVNKACFLGIDRFGKAKRVFCIQVSFMGFFLHAINYEQVEVVGFKLF